MTTAYTSLLGLALPVTGELSGTWGDTVNDYITQYLDASVAGTQTISGSQTAVTLSKTTNASLSQAGSGATGSSQYNVINCTGNPASMLTVTVPAASKTYVVVNATSTNQDVKIVGAGPTTGVTLVAGERAIIAWNGSDFIKVATSTADGVTTLSFGSTGLTPSTATSGAVTVAGTLVAANGGTGQSSYTTGDLLYATGSTALSKLGIGTNGQILTSTGTAPQWSTLSGVAVTTFSAGTTGFTPSSATSGAVTLAGTLATTNGGTGLTSFTANGVVYASSTSALTTGSALSFDGTNFATTGSGTVKNLLLTAGTLPGAGNPSISLRSADNVVYHQSGSANTIVMLDSAQNTMQSIGATAQIWNISNTEQMRLTSTGLGIGTSSPAAKLSVKTTGAQVDISTSATDLVFEAIDRTTTSNPIDTKFYTRNGTFQWYNGQYTERMRLDSSGNLGLGVTPSAGTSGKVFQITNAGHFMASGPTVYIDANAYFDSGWKYITTAAASNYYQNSGAHIWQTAPSGTAGDIISFTQAMTLDAGGRLLLGTTSSIDNNLTLQIDTPASSSRFIGINRNGGYGLLIGYDLGGVDYANIRTVGAYPLTFGTNNTERFRIAGNGAWGLAGANYGTAGQVLTSNGSGSAPTWQNAGGGGSAATPTALGTVYGSMTTAGASPYLTALGYNAAPSVTGVANTAVGFEASKSNTSGTNNTSIGYYAGRNNTTGTLNTAVGSGVLQSNTGTANTGVGVDVCRVTTGSYNTGVGSYDNGGYSPLWSNTSGQYNIGIGNGALGRNTTASQNIAIGYQAMSNNTTGENNTAVGTLALASKTTGDNNTAVGFSALYSASTSSSNTAVGYYALFGNTTGYYNVSVGRESSRAMTTGYQNTAVGDFALWSNTTGQNNAALGFYALYSNTTSSGHVAIGAGALQSLATGAVNSVAIGQNALTNFNPSSNATNTAVGGSALSACTTGAGNVALGRLALTALTTGQVNIAIGSDDGVGNWAGTLKSLTTGSSNIAIGPNALTNLTTGGKNIGIGERALQNATTPNHNIAIGCVGGSIGNGPLQSCTTGAINIAIGGEALASLTTANGNTAVGYGSMIFATTAPNNTAVGGYTLAQTTTGEANTAVGYQAGNSNTTGIWNTLNGYQSGYYITTGSQNTLIGAYNGNYVVQLTTGSYNIHLGTYCYSSSSSVNNEIVIGYNNAGKGANTGFITSTSGVYQGNNSSSWSTTSDFRLKKNIVDNNEGIDIISQIRVRNFEYRLPEEITELPEHTAIKRPGVQLGVIAQELQQVCPDCVKEESTGVLSVDSDNVFWHMVNAIKQLKAEVDSLKAQINQGA